MTTLDYITPNSHPANPAHAKRMVAVAWACWLVPLGLGMVAMVGYGLTRRDAFAGLGALALMGGTVAALGGLILMVLTYSFTARVEPEIRSRLRSRASVALVGILLNFPIAFICVIVGASLPTRIHLSVSNAGKTDVIDVHLDVLGTQVDIGDLKPGERWSGSVRGKQGRAAVAWTDSGGRHESVWDEYADSDTFWTIDGISISGDEAVWD